MIDVAGFFVGQAFVILVTFLAILMLLYGIAGLYRRKSKEYRQEMADMYVVGKIKQFAKKDGIDLLDEWKQFKKFNKEKKIDYESLDNTIEREMQEEIQQELDKKLKESK